MIEILDISKTYKRKYEALNNVSFDFKKEDIIAFVGDNGAGKTTTIKAIFNELNLNNGSILIDGENIFSNNNLSRIAFFSDIENTNLNIRVDKYLQHFGLIKNQKLKDINERIDKNLELLDISELKTKRIKELSGGQKKRVILAGVLMQSPEYIFFDEPTANMDVESKIEFLEIISDINKNGVGILITSHNIDELQKVANKLILLEQGKVIYNKKIDKEKENILEIYSSLKTTKRKKVDIDSLMNENIKESRE
ncbi:ABC transporter ATP-binding protein [Spiroplasma chinense]|uniref:ABC transporter ATP-binding protein n=1 Tax=Spiroplasma chinense TaxID=216932 RepID=A0A5B9Y6Q3_9MOLU|nr:ABC transporter ATP-binding protein [Spiroplasma chinense]QEH62379.1 ABC transporter ATP-binding protein [Spiroplasma chinense]